ncbi:hypothetical protein JD292_01415 [Leucobacter sp. CSA2]|uniref:Uncharacterized protein n=1 Tax=Leucobacter edaphi TaxID=2796472 RepID=A0A934UWA0_9MICO|nr:DUF6350 family protein [Leucobacter edaphi]MBK0420740.1 hypothetical protein [Leucobacter edaphi]
MRSFVTAVIAAIEAAAVALAGVIAVAIPVLLIWIVTFGLAAEPAAVASWVAGIWLLGHLVPLGFTVPAESALAFGLPPEALQVGLSLAPLGITLLTAALGARSGWRFGGRGGAGASGPLGGAIGFGAIALIATLVAGPLVAAPRWLAVLVPALVYGAPALLGFLVRAARDEHEWWDRAIGGTQRALDHAGLRSAAALRGRAALVARLCGILLALLIGLAAIALAVAFVVGYARIIELSQSLQMDPLGSILVFIAQLVALPIGVLWAAAWLTGGGFAIGVGTSVTPFETLLGPLPALPIFGAIPQGWGALGALPPAILALAAIAAGAVFARRTDLRRASWPVAVIIPLLAGAFAGLIVAGLSALATGSIGPDRLASTGSSPWLVGGLAAAELGIGALIGVSAARFDVARVREAIPEELPGSAAVRGMRERVSERVGAVAASVQGARGGDRSPRGGADAPEQAPERDESQDDLPTLPIAEGSEDSLIAAAYSSASGSVSAPGSGGGGPRGDDRLDRLDDPDFADQETDVVEPLPRGDAPLAAEESPGAAAESEADEWELGPDAEASPEATPDADAELGEEAEAERERLAARRAAREARAAERAAAAEAAREAEDREAERAAAESDALLAYSWDPSVVTEESSESVPDQDSSPRRKLGWRGVRRGR